MITFKDVSSPFESRVKVQAYAELNGETITFMIELPTDEKYDIIAKEENESLEELVNQYLDLLEEYYK
jgi:hypothetical protein